MGKFGENFNIALREKFERKTDPLLASMISDFEKISKKHALSESEMKKKSREAKSQSAKDEERFFRRFRKEEMERQRRFVAQDLYELKKDYWRMYPDRIQEVELFFGIAELNQIQRELDRQRAAGETKNFLTDRKKTQMFEFLTGWNYLATDTIIKNKDDKDYLEQFWNTMEKTNDSLNGKGLFSGRKRGLIGQAGVYHLMRELGLNPELATPSEDALQKTDFNLGISKKEKVVVQAKHSGLAEKLVFERTDNIHYPSVRTQDNDTAQNYAAKNIEEMTHLVDSCKRQSERLGKKVFGYYIVAPEGSFDPTTAIPKPELIKRAEKKLASLSQ